MKIMTCRELGGACDLEFKAETFEEMAELSKQHGMEMHKQQDSVHLEAMKRMGELMQSENEMAAWYDAKRQQFEALPEI